MKITGIEKTKKGRYSVYVDGAFLCALHPDIFAAASIRAGDAAEPDTLVALQRASEEKITRDRALRLLSARSYASGGLRKKLLVYTDSDIADAVVARMQELGLIDDADYARRYAADCMNLRNFSLARTRLALLEKGIPGDIADDALADMDIDPAPAIARIIIRKYAGYSADEKSRIRAVNGLLRLGYRHGDIREVMRNFEEDPDYYTSVDE
ncbi:MAG: recombination regulator RecX [Oscillospiraceae bacterium]|jgi:regulatory protein|nr:recombination regulator RecX [Oscillospiraceae bacterium]